MPVDQDVKAKYEGENSNARCRKEEGGNCIIEIVRPMELPKEEN
jgi:hypothetical protein